MTKLEAVNRLLSKIGFSPVVALDTGGASMHANAERKIDQCSDDIQRRGWHFNTFNDVELTPDGDDEIAVPTGTIYHIDTYGRDASRNVTRQGSILYDHENNVATFTDTLHVTYSKQSAWDDVPPSFQAWIVSEAAILFVRDYAQNLNRQTRREILQELDLERAQDRTVALQEQGDASDLNLLHTPEARRLKGNRNTTHRQNII